jgi:S-adenosylmethionine:tRNA ribosyltransferase-isomerase
MEHRQKIVTLEFRQPGACNPSKAVILRSFSMDSTLFNYHLPADRIAQEPSAKRDDSKLMVVDRKTKKVTHARFADIGNYLPPTTRFFRNNVAVLKARIFGYRPSGGKVECLLLQPAEDACTWWCLLRPGKKTLRSGTFGIENEYSAEVLGTGKNGNYRVRFHLAHDESVSDLSERLGMMPLPPYIQRDTNDPRCETDNERYQTVYADYEKRLAVAAPTAGLHFTEELIDTLKARDFQFHDLTLQVGIGTFHPIQTDNILDHEIHREWYEIPADTLSALKKQGPGPRVAVGTTSVRSIEDVLRRIENASENCVTPSGSAQAEADIFIYPPFQFKGVDALITNFHLPKSTLLCLVSAFLTPGEASGIQWLLELYEKAIEHDYRFYSYGDAMLII